MRTPCQVLTRQYVCPAQFDAAVRRSRSSSEVGGHTHVSRRSRRNQAEDQPRRPDRRDRPAAQGGRLVQGPVPVPRREDALLHRHARARNWKCFGCGRGGDVFNFVMERDSIDFPEALRRLAQRAGVELSERTSREDAQRKRLRDVLDAAIAFYHRVLTESHHGQPALDYLRAAASPTRRSRPTCSATRVDCLGHAQSRALIEKRNFALEDLEAAGLVPRAGRRPRRLRPLPRPDHLPHPRRERQRDRPRRPDRRHRAAGRQRPRHRSQVPQLAGNAAVRQEPDAVPHRSRQERHPQAGVRGPRRGQHGRADGPPAGLRERRRHARHGADRRRRSSS